MMTLMNDDFIIRILIQSVVKSVVRNDVMKVVSDNQNGRENDQRRKHDIDTTKKQILFASKSLFFYIVLLLLIVEALEHLRLLFLVSGETCCFSPNEGNIKFRVANKT